MDVRLSRRNVGSLASLTSDPPDQVHSAKQASFVETVYGCASVANAEPLGLASLASHVYDFGYCVANGLGYKPIRTTESPTERSLEAESTTFDKIRVHLREDWT